MSGHSIGPWWVRKTPWRQKLQNGKFKEHWTVCGPKDDATTNIAVCASNASAIDNAANARLISAAPELLEALVEAFYCVTSQPCNADLLHDMIIPALEKATGGLPPQRIPEPRKETTHEG